MLVAGLLEVQARLDRGAVVAGQLERAGVAQEVGRVEQVDVEGVALDPLAAVEEAAQGADLRVDGDPEEPCSKACDGAHLVGDRADAADAGDDVDDLVGRAAHDELLEVARRLEDPQARLVDCPVADAQAERAFALDAGQAGDVDAGRRSSRWAGRCHASSAAPRFGSPGPGGPPWASIWARNGPDQAVKPAEQPGDLVAPTDRRRTRPRARPRWPPRAGRSSRSSRARRRGRSRRSRSGSPARGRAPLGDDDADDAAPLALDAHGLVGQLRLGGRSRGR